MQTAKRTVGFCWGILFLLLAGVVLACPNAALSQLRPQPKLTRISVTITPQKATLFVGDTQAFVARVLGGANKTVTCGTVMNQGLYTAPKIQGVYHVTASSIASPQQRAVATVTVLTNCDVPTTSIGS